MQKLNKSNRKQGQAWNLLQKRDKIYVLLDGGSRSGKSLIIALNQILLARDYPGTRHLVARLHFSDAKTSIWHETYIPLLKQVLWRRQWHENKTDWYIKLWNESEIWLGGFDDRERTEKILGHEYNTIYLNEVSQISYLACEMALPRLAIKTPGLVNKAFFDCNPPSPLHWIHKLFYDGINPATNEPLLRPDLYGKVKLNPIDNVANLESNYIETKLDVLSDRMRRRMRDGEYVKAEGVVYEGFSDECIIEKDDVPDLEFYTVGLDFGLNMAAVLIGWAGEHVYILDDYGVFNYTASAFNEKISVDKGWAQYNYIAYCDPSGGERIQEITNGDKANNSVEPGIDYINTKIEQGEFHVVRGCNGVPMEINDYIRNEKEKIVKTNDHFMDAMRYGIFSRVAVPPQIFL